jgi:hypothetical protein
MANSLNIPWCKVILPQAPLYTMQGQEMQSWAELDPISETHTHTHTHAHAFRAVHILCVCVCAYD